MALQTSGTISIDDLVTEFGGTAPHAMSEYYRGGGLVPDTGTNSGIPTSGQIDLNDFYGGDATTQQQGYIYMSGRSKFGRFLSGGQTTWDVMSKLPDISTVLWNELKNNKGNGVVIAKRASDNTIWGWGNGQHYNVPSATQINSSPLQIASGEWEKLGDNCSAIKPDGKAWAWGMGHLGQLGNNSSANQSSPVQELTNSTNWQSLNGSTSAQCGLKSDGKMWNWGMMPISGQVFYSSPVQLDTSSSWSSATHTGPTIVGTKTDNRLWVYGHNYRGRLGVGTYDDASYATTFQQTAAATSDWDHAPMGYTMGMGIKTDGKLWAWGAGYDTSSLGWPALSNYSSPVESGANRTDWVNVYGMNYTCAFFNGNTTSGNLWYCHTSLTSGTMLGNPVDGSWHQVGTDTDWIADTFYADSYLYDSGVGRLKLT